MKKRENQNHYRIAPSRSIELQKALRKKVRLIPLKKKVRTVGGVDVSFSKLSDTLWAGVVVYEYPELKEVESKWIRGRADFPYIPGLLSFRELPHILDALSKLTAMPDVIICDGQGIAHPRGLGIASHLGVIQGVSTIGCAKSRLIGEYVEPNFKRGSYSPLLMNNKVVGVVLRTKDNVRPVFVSPGHMITLQEAIEIVLNTTTHYRIPEPVRSAHNLVNRIRTHQKAV